MEKQISVIIATHNRLQSLIELLELLGKQTLSADTYEVIVVDDGSEKPVKPHVESLSLPYALTVLEQKNAGPGAARDNGIRHAKAEVVVIVDDDMHVPPDFLEQHQKAHEAGYTLVLGHIGFDESLGQRPLFERFHAAQLAKHTKELTHEHKKVRGSHVCTGNVSLRKSEYLAVGGFDPTLGRSEDRELGVRLEMAGAKLTHCDAARSTHRSDSDWDVWMRRSYLYGIYDLKISRKHPTAEIADPWSYIFMVNPISRPILLLDVASPRIGKLLSKAAMKVSVKMDELGAERVAIAGVTLVFGLEYFRGVRTEAGSLRNVARDIASYLRKRRSEAAKGTSPDAGL